MYLVFNNNLSYKYSINALSEEGAIVTIQSKEEIPDNDSGFIIYGSDESVLGDFSNYTTKYNITDIGNAVMYSCDNSIETEDSKLNVYYESLSLKQIRGNILDSLKDEKIQRSKKELTSFLENNPLISSCHGNKECVYSVTLEKQSLMMGQYMTYQIEKQINDNAVLTWNESGEECEVWTEEEFLQLMLEIKQYVYPVVSYQQSIEKMINSCETVEDFDNIDIDYEQFVK